MKTMKTLMPILSVLAIFSTATVHAESEAPDQLKECKTKIAEASEADQNKAKEYEAELLKQARGIISHLNPIEVSDIKNQILEGDQYRTWNERVSEIFAEGDSRWDAFKPRLLSTDFGRMKAAGNAVNYYLPLINAFGTPIVRVLDLRNKEFKKIDYYLSNEFMKYDTDIRFNSAEFEAWNSLPEICQAKIDKPDSQSIYFSKGDINLSDDAGIK